MSAGLAVANRSPSDAFRQEVERLVAEPDARAWMIASIDLPSVNAKYWAESILSFSLGRARYHAGLTRGQVRADLLWLWRHFRRSEGGFSQIQHDKWSSVFATVYAIRAMRMFLPPEAGDVASDRLLGGDVVEACRVFVRDLWRDGTFIDSRRVGQGGERSLTKLYYAIVLLHVLSDGRRDNTLGEAQWASVMAYLRECLVRAGAGIGFEYRPDAKTGGWACTTYYGVRLLRYFKDLRALSNEEFNDQIKTGLGLDGRSLEEGIGRFMKACWEPSKGCHLSPARQGEPTLNHTYMYVRVLDGLLGFGTISGRRDPEELQAIIVRSEVSGGGYALAPHGIANLASTYVATRLWGDILDNVSQGEAGVPRERMLDFVRRCSSQGPDGYQGYALVEQRGG